MIFTQGNPSDHVSFSDHVETFNKFREIITPTEKNNETKL